MSSAELSVEIYHLVTRAVGGEPVDVATRSEELAARYPHLGLSAPLIGKAIARAAAMVGVALDGIGEAPPPLTDAPHAQPAAKTVNGFHPNEVAMPATPSRVVPSPGSPPDLSRGRGSRSSTTDAGTPAPGGATPDAEMSATRSRVFPTSPSSTTDAETSASEAPGEPDRDAALRRIFIRE